MSGKGIKVITEDTRKHPKCAHGPTILFSRLDGNTWRNFFACAACRDRKDCSFFIWQDEQNKISNLKVNIWKNERKNFIANINHRKLFLTLNEIKNLSSNLRMYCNTCCSFELPKFQNKHLNHDYIKELSDYQILHPTELIKPLENAKKEAQYFFSKQTIATIINMLKQKNFRNVLCVGAPRIHEYITNECQDMNSLLLDIDKRFHNFFGPLQFCWYNSFNHHFFFNEAEEVFNDFLQSNGGKDLVLITDPPFGGRTELLIDTFEKINNLYKSINNITNNLPMFWIFPYFMEPQIVNRLQDFSMLDYKVLYDNHPLFKNGPNGKKQGSPIRIFTNLNPKFVKLPEDEGYKYCKLCKRWVSSENKHCKMCNSCTSKDGRTYVHCKLCSRCVKPTWQHCKKCNKCAKSQHVCQKIEFTQECFNCKKVGHKRKDCTDLNLQVKKRKIVKNVKK